MQDIYHTGITIDNNETDLSDLNINDQGGKSLSGKAAEELALDGAIVYEFYHTTARVTYPEGIKKGVETVKIHIELVNNTPHQQHGFISYYLPKGLRGEVTPKHVMIQTKTLCTEAKTSFEAELTVTEEAEGTNRGVIQVLIENHPTVILIPILGFGA